MTAPVSGACQAHGGPGPESGPMRNSAIAASGLRKAYKDKVVLDGIDLDVETGTVFSLLGPNGAGKTTTVNVLTTLIKADGGTALVAGHDVATETKAVRAAIGVTGQFAAVDELLTGQENLQLMADLKRLSSGEAKRVVTDLLERFDLTESAHKLASTYSGGMRRKLDLAMTLADRPADRIAVLDQGHLVAQGTPGELKRQIPGSHVRLRFAGDPDVETVVRLLPGSARDDEDDLTVRVPSDGGAKSVRALLNQLDEHSIEVEDFSVHTPDLDDVFLALTGHASTEENAR